MDLNNIERIHFIGIGGIGMSALARFFLHEKKIVSGSDQADSIITVALVKEGVTFYSSQTAENISSNLDLVVYTEAMAKTNPEMMAAKALGVPMLNYFDALALVANQYYLIAVAGSHGKTTTTAMLADILEEASFDPTVIVGSLRSKTGSNFRPGKSKYALVEACEYKRDFLSLTPDVLVITNVEYEHVDYYRDLADVQSAFRELALKLPSDGALITNVTDPNLQPILVDLPSRIIDSRPELDLNLKLRLPGLHNKLNASCAMAAAKFLGIEAETIKTALENFAGTWRRFEYKGEVNGAKIYDDYAHHPTEIRVTMAGARELYPDKKLIIVFQSHTYSRTKELFADFVTELSKADEVMMLPIYAAREENTNGVSAEQLLAEIQAKGIETHFFYTAPAMVEFLKEHLSADEVVLVMGAGAVTEVATLLTK